MNPHPHPHQCHRLYCEHDFGTTTFTQLVHDIIFWRFGLRMPAITCRNRWLWKHHDQRKPASSTIPNMIGSHEVITSRIIEWSPLTYCPLYMITSQSRPTRTGLDYVSHTRSGRPRLYATDKVPINPRTEVSTISFVFPWDSSRVLHDSYTQVLPTQGFIPYTYEALRNCRISHLIRSIMGNTLANYPRRMLWTSGMILSGHQQSVRPITLVSSLKTLRPHCTVSYKITPLCIIL